MKLFNKANIREHTIVLLGAAVIGALFILTPLPYWLCFIAAAVWGLYARTVAAYLDYWLLGYRDK